MKGKSIIICSVTALFFLYEFIQITMLDSLAPVIMSSLHISAEKIVIISAAYYYTNIILLIPAGFILDRYPLKYVVPSAILISVIGTFTFSCAHSLKLAILSRLISGIGGAFSFNCCAKAAIKYFSFEKFPLIIGLTTSLAFLGGIGSHAPLLYLATKGGWNHAVLLLALFGSVVFLLNILVYSREESSKTQILSKLELSNLIGVLRNKFTWIGGVFTSLMNLPVVLLAAMWSTLYLTEINHLPGLSASFCSSATFVGLIIGSPIVGILVKNQKNMKRLMQFSSFALIILSVIFVVPTQHSIQFLYATFFMLGLVSSSQTVGYSIVAQNNKVEYTSLAMSVTSIIVLSLGCGLKILFGKILDLGWRGVINKGLMIYSSIDFSHAMLILPLSFLISFAIACYYPKNA